MNKKVCMTVIFLIFLSSFIFGLEVKIRYREGNHGNATDNHIKPHIIIENNGNDPVDMNDLTIRYYYTKEGTASEAFCIDYAWIGGLNITNTFHNGYVEIGFTRNAGMIAGGSTSGEIQIRFYKNDWSDYNETDDYSYNISASSYIDWDKITLYQNGILVWGVEPEGASPVTTPDPTPSIADPEPGDGLFTESDGLIVIEAEHYTDTAPGTGSAGRSYWKEESSYYNSSNGLALRASPNRGVNVGDSTNGPRLDYDVYFNTTGTYYFWVRMSGPRISDDSIHGGLNGIPASYGQTGLTITSYYWKWVNMAAGRVTVEVESPGLYTVNIWMREDGTRIDKFILTTDAGYTPSGQGPGESPREPLPTPVPEPPHPAGEVWVFPEEIEVSIGDSFSTELHLNSGDQLFAAYGINLSYNSSILSEIKFSPGPDGFLSAYGADNTGYIMMSGFDASGTGPGSDLHILTIEWTAIGAGTTTLEISVVSLVDVNTDTIGIPAGKNGTATVIESAATQTPVPTPTAISVPTPTPEHVPGPGDVWVEPADSVVSPGELFVTEIHLNSGTQKIAAYGMDVTFDESIIRLDTGTGSSGVEAGADGFVAAVSYAHAGLVRMSGFDASGTGPGSDLHLLTIYWTAMDTGTAHVDIEINTLVDEATNEVGLPYGIPGTVTVSGGGGVSSPPTPVPTPVPEPTAILSLQPGDVFLVPSTITITEPGNFETEIHVHSGEQKIAAYGMDISYYPNVISISDVRAGADGFLSAGAGSGLEGEIRISGFYASGTGPGEDLHLLTLSWKPVGNGSSNIGISVYTLVDENTDTIGNTRGIGGSVTVSGLPDPTPTLTPSLTPTPTVVPDPTNTPSPTPEPTPETSPLPGTGDVWMLPVEISVDEGVEFETKICINSGYERIASYGFELQYDNNVVQVNTRRGKSGVLEGPDGYVIAVNADPGLLTFAGFDNHGTGPGSDLDFMTVYWLAVGAGSTYIDLIVNTLTNELATRIDTATGTGSHVTVTATTTTPVPTLTPEPTQTPESVEGVGNVWFVPQDQTVNSGDLFTTEIHVNSGTHIVKTYGIDIYFDVNVIDVNSNIGVYGVEIGTEGFLTGVNINTPGKIHVNGADYGLYSGYDLHLVTIHWIAKDEGNTLLDFDVRSLLYETGTSFLPIGTPNGTDGTVSVIFLDETPEPTPEPPVTPEPTIELPSGSKAGDVWFVPGAQTVDSGSQFITEVHVNTETQMLAAYGIDIYYNDAVVTVDTATGTSGVETGPDGFVTAVNPDDSGVLKTSGFDVAGKGPGDDLYIYTIYWISVGTGTTSLDLDIRNLTDINYNVIGIPAGESATVTVQ